MVVTGWQRGDDDDVGRVVVAVCRWRWWFRWCDDGGSSGVVVAWSGQGGSGG
nr:hypothetical protein [Tanacetum cinerariifolium]